MKGLILWFMNLWLIRHFGLLMVGVDLLWKQNIVNWAVVPFVGGWINYLFIESCLEQCCATFLLCPSLIVRECASWTRTQNPGSNLGNLLLTSTSSFSWSNFDIFLPLSKPIKDTPNSVLMVVSITINSLPTK
jgi:hypothetical protein